MAEDQAKSGAVPSQKSENPFVKKEAPVVPAKLDSSVIEKSDLKKEVSKTASTGQRNEFKEKEAIPINPFAINKNGVEKKSVQENQTSTPEKEMPKVEEKKKEVIDVAPKDVSSTATVVPVTESVPEEEENFWTVLAHAGISKKTLIMVAGFFVFVIVAVVVLLTVDFSPAKPEETAVEKPAEVQVEAENNGQDLDSNYIVGLENKSAISPDSPVKPLGYYGDLSGITSVLVIGNVPSAEKIKFIAFIKLLDRMQNIYTTDIYGLLDKSVDRRAALEEFIQTMDSVIKQGETAYNQIQQEMNLINAQYEQTTESRDQYETFFFEAAQNLYGDDAYKNLTTFIDLEKQAVTLKSQHSADKTLSDMFANSVNALKPRYQDVTANVDALIKGVHVFDIPDSEINAIIRLGQK